MCGIVAACLSEGGVVPTLIAGLKSLEYRGYDSAGLALHSPGFPIRKRQGRVADLEGLVNDEPLPEAATGIAHTRWASHGRPNDVNAHPHAFGSLVLVHNGILENHEALKEEFEPLGYHYASETDSEIWAALIHAEIGEQGAEPGVDEILSALARAMKKAHGSFALAFMHEAHPGRIFFARRESPLVLGLADHARFVASDIPAVLSATRDFLYLEDGMLGTMTAREHRVLDLDLNPLDLPAHHITWDAEQAEKNGYPHFMLKEIEEQPLVLARTIQAACPPGGGFLPDFPMSDRQLASFERLVILACGTALHAARYGKSLIEGSLGMPVEVDFASEFRYRDPIVGQGDLVLAVSQSGETADTLGALKVAVEKGGIPISLCNVRGSSLCRMSEAVLQMECGPEIGVASTKAFMGQLLGLHLLALKLGRAQGRIDVGEFDRWLEVLRGARFELETLVSPEARGHVERLGRKYAEKPVFFFLGRGPDYPFALEGALKLKEISYVHAEGYPAGEMKHGPLALVSDDMVVVALVGRSPVYEKVIGNLREVQARGGTMIVITNEGRKEALEIADEVILVPECDSLVAPLMQVIPLQYLAYYVALTRGCDIDKPRNLAKSVTIE